MTHVPDHHDATGRISPARFDVFDIGMATEAPWANAALATTIQVRLSDLSPATIEALHGDLAQQEVRLRDTRLNKEARGSAEAQDALDTAHRILTGRAIGEDQGPGQTPS